MSGFLWLLLFLVVPILVHLFNFRRARRLFFTNVRVIQQVSSETKSKTRLKHLLILTTRILILIALILSFYLSQFGLEDNDFVDNSSIGSYYLDNSYSSVGLNQTNFFRIAESVVMQSEANEGYYLTNDFAPFANQRRTKEEILSELELRSVSYVDRSLDEVLDRINYDSKIFIQSDFQQAASSSLDRIKNDTTRSYYLLYNSNQRLRNVYVDSVWIERNIDDYTSYDLKCFLGRSNSFDEGNIVIKLLDDNGNQLSSVVKNLAESLEVEFTLPWQRSKSFLTIQIVGDEVEYDNQFHLIVEPSYTPSILILSESPNKYLESVFNNSELFKSTVANSSQIDYEVVKEMDMVILNDFYRLPAGIVNQNIEELSFLIVPSDSIDIENYVAETGVLVRSETSDGFYQIEIERANSLVKGLFDRVSDNTNLPNARSFYSLSSTHEEILKLRNGNTLLAKDIGRPLYFFTSPLNDASTNLPNHSIFLPIMYRIVERETKSSVSVFLFPNDFLEVEILKADVPPRIVANGVEVIPEFAIRNQDGLVRIPNNLSPGFYHVLQGSDTVKSFGLNLPKSESIQNGPTQEELVDFFEGAEHVEIVSASQDYEETALAGVGRNSIWKYALILAVFFILLETLFHRYLK